MVLSRVRGTIRRGQEPDRLVDAVIPLHQSNGDRQQDTKAPCGYDSRKQARQVETGFFPEPVTSAGNLDS